MASIEFIQEVTLRGSIPEADQDRMTFELHLIHGPKVEGQIMEQHREIIIEAFKGYRDGVRVLVEGIGRYDRRSQLCGLESVEQISILDPLDVPARLDEFREMKDGWLDGDGKAPEHKGLDWLSRSFERHYPDDLPLPYTYPTPEGGVQMEWPLGRQSVIFEIDLAAHQGDWFQFDKQSDDDDEDSQFLHLDDSNSWAWLTNEIRRMAESME